MVAHRGVETFLLQSSLQLQPGSPRHRCLLPFVPRSSCLPAFSRRLLPCFPSLGALSPLHLFCQQTFCFFVFVEVPGALPPPLLPPAVPTRLLLAHTVPGEQEYAHQALPALHHSVPNTYSCHAHRKAAPVLLSTPETHHGEICHHDPVGGDEAPLAQREGTVGSRTLSTAGWHWLWALRAVQGPTGSQALVQPLHHPNFPASGPSGHPRGWMS